ncbi:MAG TPA: prolyl oligopeptidase family serine peptidase [Acidimicrobiia bacterium]|nr:prolyl oligopeptidase family serine peptidase [Acidimicrobiia bacterium]
MRALALVLGIIVTGCAVEGRPQPEATNAPPVTGTTGDSTNTTVVPVSEYLPGLEARLHLPAPADRVPLLVMVPGGGWSTADPAGFEGLARDLAMSGILAAAVEVRAAEDDVLYPVPVEDVLCAVAHSVAWARSNGFDAGPVVLLGHSSGAHLASLAVLAPSEFSSGCPDQLQTPDALVGLAGTYDVGIVSGIARNLFGVSPETDPALWESGNPLLRAALRPEVPVLLIHGDADDLVPTSFTTEVARALKLGGHAVTVQMVPGADHHEIYSAEASGDLITDWIAKVGRSD